MPVKKKSKKPKKKVIKLDPPVYQIPVYEDPDIVTPKVSLTIKHHQMDIPNDFMTLKISMMITAPIERVAKAICKHHQESIQNVIICKDQWDPQQALPHEFSLEKCGITGGQVNLFYDYVPFTNPLIG